MRFDLDRPYALDPEAVAAFRRDGFVRLKAVLTPQEIAHYGEAITRLTLALADRARPLEERSTYGKAFLQVTNLWEHDRTARAFVFGKRLARIAAELLEVEGVRLYHDQALIKEAGGGITPAHADQFYWPLASDRCVTAWVPLQAVPAEMGPIGFYAGSQRFEFGRDLPISDESERLIGAEMEKQGFALVDDPFELGEASFHLGWTFHRAGANLTDRPRSAMTIIYMDKDMRLATPSAGQLADREAFCPGVAVGDVIASPKSPLLWERPG
ncbi:MAG TPA: phytanoyl-CoA dioxygenase family protein [Sphingomicrobium sp.]|nr:phytanoyl-CoA dioxygenase family protein [Sphingomicrobium sp.]